MYRYDGCLQKGDKKESIGGNLLQRRKESDPGSNENKSAATSIAGAIASGVRGSVLFPGAIDLHAQANINSKYPSTFHPSTVQSIFRHHV